MSFPDPNHPPSFPGGGFWAHPANPEQFDSHSQNENLSPYKRPRMSENKPHNSGRFAPMNPKMNTPNFPGGKGTGYIFYKTRMCAKFLEGTCLNGDHCTFAHGSEDLREPPPNWQEIMREKERGERGPGNWNDDQRNIHRMKICKRYYNGEECSYGDKCSFLHERPMERQRERESSAISIGTSGHFMGSGGEPERLDNRHGNHNSEAFRVKPVFWKTRMCTKWEMTGHCPFGEKCHYAHGQSELKVSGGGRIQVEPAVKSGSIPVKPLSVPVVDPSSADLMANDPSKEEADQKKLSKWKSTKKLNRIYADWIDDLSPSHDSASDEEA